MPIGKNSLKRVANNGYSNVKTEAPDMENSVEVKQAPAVKRQTAKKTATEAKKAPSSTGRKPAAKKSTAEKKPSLTPVPEKASVKIAEPEASASYVNIGRGMPSYLL